MTETTRRPTKAEVEYDDDCFGKFYSKDAPECKICLVGKRCRFVREHSDDKELDVAKKEKTAKKEEKTEKAEKAVDEKVAPLAKRYKKDKENCGWRPGSAGWAAFVVMKESCGKTFTIEELAKKTVVFCKSSEVKEQFGKKINFNADAKIGIAIRDFKKLGLIKRVGKDEFKKVI